jgi:F-type H+-transporting ATPase subunit a
MSPTPILVLLLLAAPGSGEGTQAPHPAAEETLQAAQAPTPHGPVAPAGEVGGVGRHGDDDHEGAGDAGHGGPAAIIMHHVMDTTYFGFPSKHLVFFVLAALLVIVVARLTIRSYRNGQVPRGLGGAVEAVVLFIRDEVAEASIGHGDGKKYTPLLCSFFFFILIAALLGLVPLPTYENGKWGLAGTTSTGNIMVTAALAGISFVAQQYAGISKYGLAGHFKNLIPPGVPWALVPVIGIVEVIGIFTKPFALMIRLFANMLAGHMVVTTLLLLIALMAEVSVTAGVLMTPVSLVLALFIDLLEILVAFIQAYIFTLLTAIFIGMYAHPAH